MAAQTQKIGTPITVTCPTTGITKEYIVTGRNWWGDKLLSYMVGNSKNGRCITTVNPDGVSQFSLA